VNLLPSTDTLAVKPKWRERFAFFDAYGAPSSAAFHEAIKRAPRGTRRRVNFNFLAFFFGPFYLLGLGLWKKALSLVAVVLGLAVLELTFSVATGIDVPRPIDSALNIATALLFGLSTNYAYYLKQVKGCQNWNPFEGLRMF
jgi:hypothetical protein